MSVQVRGLCCGPAPALPIGSHVGRIFGVGLKMSLCVVGAERKKIILQMDWLETKCFKHLNM